MIRSAVTLTLVPEMSAGPFVFSGDLERHCARAAALGFDAVELFVRDARSLDAARLERVLADHGLAVSGFGTGPGWVVHQLRLTDPDASIRRRAVGFVGEMIDLAARFRAPVIVGSMQGRVEGGVTREQALAWLREGLETLLPRATAAGLPVLLEPLNRYETNLVITVADGLALIETLPGGGLRLLCDLFHMNIEEADMAAALRQAGARVGHVHFADSNRRAAGLGHTDFQPVAGALRAIGYEGFVSAEVLPLPDPETAARTTIQRFNELFRP